jgi:hypothetical protein
VNPAYFLISIERISIPLSWLSHASNEAKISVIFAIHPSLDMLLGVQPALHINRTYKRHHHVTQSFFATDRLCKCIYKFFCSH